MKQNRPNSIKRRQFSTFVLLAWLLLLLSACAGSSPTIQTGNATPTTTTASEDVALPPGSSPAAQATAIAAAQATELAAGIVEIPAAAIVISDTPTPTPTAVPAPLNNFSANDWAKLPALTADPVSSRLLGQISNQTIAPATAYATPTPTKKAPFTALALSPDKNVLAVADREQIWLMEANTGKLLQVVYNPGKPGYSAKPGETEEKGAASLAWSADGKKLAAGGWHGQVIMWRWEANQQRLRPGRNILQPYSNADFFGDAIEIAFSPDGNQIAGFASSGSITIWDSETLRTRSTFYSPYAGYFSWSPDGKRIADEYLNLFYLDSGQTFYPGEKSVVSDEQPQGIAFSPNGKQLAVSADGFELGLIDVPSGDKPLPLEAELKKFSPPRTTPGPAYDHFREGRRVVWSPDNKRVAIANMPSAGKISIWDNSGRKLLTIESGKEILTSLLWPTEVVMLAAGNDGVARFWQLLPATSVGLTHAPTSTPLP